MPSHYPPPQIPATFATKKSAILASLAVPDSTYTDASPKGSVDTAIKPLIDRINALEGVVTTSSCAGRVSLFLEGNKGRADGAPVKNEGAVQESGRGARSLEVADGIIQSGDSGQRSSAIPGGKGSGGRWLFVSHEAVRYSEDEKLAKMMELPQEACDDREMEAQDVKRMRFVRFQFEPMILHIMTASLHHAQSILGAAINAGFRESGVQSLKNLNDVNAFPMVAVRTSGLAFESLVGYLKEGDERVVSLITEGHLRLLLNIANERFEANTVRIGRFEDELLGRREQTSGWEDAESRKERKRAEGLARQATARTEQSRPNKTRTRDVAHGPFGDDLGDNKGSRGLAVLPEG